MNLPLFIARRYFFSRKSHSIINLISAISVGGVVLAAMALVCTLSVFNGFQDLISSLFTEFDPVLKVLPAQGKTLRADDATLARLCADRDVASAAPTLEQLALVRYADNQLVVTLKGVDQRYEQTVGIDSILYGAGSFVLHADMMDYAVLGLGVAARLGTGLRFSGPLQVYAPRKGEQINPMNPAENFNTGELYSAGLVFNVGQKKIDEHYVITSLSFAQHLFDQEGRISALELKLKPEADVEATQKRLQRLCGSGYLVQNQYEQQEDVFRVMNVEKLMSYLFLSFIALIACFNIIGSLCMLILDKRADMRTLRCLGADDKLISRIFLLEGWLIIALGAALGVVLGLALCWAQQQFGLLKMGSSEGTFLVDAYPVSVHAVDVAAVLLTVIAIGGLSIWQPVRYLTRKML